MERAKDAQLTFEEQASKPSFDPNDEAVSDMTVSNTLVPSLELVCIRLALVGLPTGIRLYYLIFGIFDDFLHANLLRSVPNLVPSVHNLPRLHSCPSSHVGGPMNAAS